MENRGEQDPLNGVGLFITLSEKVRARKAPTYISAQKPSWRVKRRRSSVVTVRAQ